MADQPGLKAIEPEALSVLGNGGNWRVEDAVNLSIAVSLKRIADAVAGSGCSQGMDLSLWEIAQRMGPQS